VLGLAYVLLINKLLDIFTSHYQLQAMSEYESGTFRCMDCAKEFLTKEEADRHHAEHHSEVEVGE
jgi:hypothetical protein